MSAGLLLLKDGKQAAWDPYVLPRSILKAWWCADDHGMANMTDDGAGLISNWIDRIGGMAVTAATTARPTWASNSFNSAYAGLTFDGVANCMVSTTLTTLPTGAVAGELWALASNAALVADSPARVAVAVGTGAAALRDLRRIVASSVNRGRSTDGTTLTADATVDLSGPHIMRGTWSGTTLGLSVDGNAVTTATMASLNTNTTRMRIGATAATSAALFWQGPIRHIFDTMPLTTAQAQQLEGWLAWDVGIQANLPSTHPYRNARP